MRHFFNMFRVLAFLAICSGPGCAEKPRRLPSSLDFFPIDPNDSPPARLDASMTVDFEGRRVFLFGGRSANGAYLSDLWAYVEASENWEKLDGENAPPGRSGASLIWDPNAKKLILFGGCRADAFGRVSYLRELWIFKPGTGWSREFFEVGPSGRAWHGAVLVGGRIILTGGYGGDKEQPEPLSDTWALDVTNLRFERLDDDGVLRRPYRPAMMTANDTGKVIVLGQVERNGRARLHESVFDLENNSHYTLHSVATEPADFRVFIADPRSGLLVVLTFDDVPGNIPEGQILLAWALAPVFVDQSLDNLPHEFFGLSCTPNPTADFSFLCFGGARGSRVSSTTWILERLEGN